MQISLSCSRFLRALFQFSKRAASEPAKFGRSGAKLLGVIGTARLESGEPATEAGELIWRQLGDSFGDLFDFHAAQYCNNPSFAGQALMASSGICSPVLPSRLAPEIEGPETRLKHNGFGPTDGPMQHDRSWLCVSVAVMQQFRRYRGRSGHREMFRVREGVRNTV
jgi:hypothetical protein